MKQSSSFTFVIFKNRSGKSYSITMSLKKLQIIIGSVFALIILLCVGIYMSYDTNIQQVAYTQLKKENTKQEADLKKLHEQLELIKDDLVDLIEKEEMLEGLLGKVRLKKKRKKVATKTFKRAYNKKIKNIKNPYDKAFSQQEILKNYVEEFNQKYAILLNRTHRIKAKFEFTPSIRPLHGRLMSRYGWRAHPVTGRRRFHKGIDIAAWTGAPIQVTADGIVEYAGWSRSFGYVVVVDHNYGIRTIYAHCSQLLVDKNEIVKKGQVIAQVGSTGLSTGPHLHYEIRRWRQSLNPVAYLDLDMFAARRRLW